MKYAVQIGLEQELEKLSSKGSFLKRLSGKVQAGKDLAKKEAKNLPNMPIDEKAAFLSGMFLNPVPGMSVTQLAALRGIKAHTPGALANKTQRQMQAQLAKIKTPPGIVGK
tara:strand:+ start:842 stop:1174 length:333 start_codon:yes stop_codon:yes gene_type:complete